MPLRMSSWIITVDSSSLEISVSLPWQQTSVHKILFKHCAHLHEQGGGHVFLGDVYLDGVLLIVHVHVRVILLTRLPYIIKTETKKNMFVDDEFNYLTPCWPPPS